MTLYSDLSGSGSGVKLLHANAKRVAALSDSGTFHLYMADIWIGATDSLTDSLAISYPGAKAWRPGHSSYYESDGTVWRASASEVKEFHLIAKGSGDCITDEAAVLAAEVYTLTLPSDSVGIEAIFNCPEPFVVYNNGTNSYALFPRCRGVLISIGAEDATAAAARMSKTYVGPGVNQLSNSQPSDLFQLSHGCTLKKSWARGAVELVHVGFLDINTGVFNATGATPGDATDVVVGGTPIARYIDARLFLSALSEPVA